MQHNASPSRMNTWGLGFLACVVATVSGMLLGGWMAQRTPQTHDTQRQSINGTKMDTAGEALGAGTMEEPEEEVLQGNAPAAAHFASGSQ